MDVVGRRGRPVVFGEVLFDRFPDGVEVLGGAPFNVAWHLQGFAAEPWLITCVGDDERGLLVRKAMRDWGMDLTGLQVNSNFPTGVVDILFAEGGHTFDILPDQAYDQISSCQFENPRIERAELLYHGTLILRTARMRKMMSAYRLLSNIPRFVDLNLREPWIPENLLDCLRGTVWVKVNEAELETVARQLDCLAPSLDDSAQAVRQTLESELLIVTLGQRGAVAFSSSEGRIAVSPEPIHAFRDTIGAGDAFSAVTILGLIRKWPLRTIMGRAQAFASEIVQQRGATSRDSALYEGFSQQWGLSRTNSSDY